jgi:hypothetical protein
LAAREAKLEAAARKAAKAEKQAARRKAAEAAWDKKLHEFIMAAWASPGHDKTLADEARAALERDVAALAGTEGFDSYNLAKSLATGSPGRLGASARVLSGGRLGQTDQISLELAFWLAAAGLAELPPPERLTLIHSLAGLVLAAKADHPARALAAAELARGGSARRSSEVLERHLDSLPGLARAETEAVPGRVLALDVPIPGVPASEILQTLMRVLESFSGWRRVIIGLFHHEGLSLVETAGRLKVDPRQLHPELRHGYERLASALKAYLTRLAVARGHGLADFPGLDGLRGGRPTLSPIPSRGELPPLSPLPALEPPEGADTTSAVESESAALARRLALLSPDGFGPDIQPAYELAFWLAAAGLSEPPPPQRPRPDLVPRYDRFGRLHPPRRRRPISAPSRIFAPPASEALGVLTRFFERSAGRRRLIFRLLYREGLDILEAGRRSGLSESLVRSERGAGLKSLAGKFRDYLIDPARTPGRPAAGRPGVDQPGADQPGADQPGVAPLGGE